MGAVGAAIGLGVSGGVGESSVTNATRAQGSQMVNNTYGITAGSVVSANPYSEWMILNGMLAQLTKYPALKKVCIDRINGVSSSHAAITQIRAIMLALTPLEKVLYGMA